MKISGILIFLLLVIATSTGCLDFAHKKDTYEQEPVQTEHRGGRTITIEMQGVDPDEALSIAERVMQEANKHKNGGGQ